MRVYLKIDDNLSGIQLYKILNTNLKISKRLITKLKKYNQIFCNDIPVFTNYLVKENDTISAEIDFDEDINDNIVPLNKELEIIFEDESLLIVNKTYNMPTHPSLNHFDDTLSNIVKNYYLKNNINRQIRPVNRLDKDTSGIVIFAKNQYAQEHLISQMKNNTFKKEYIAIVNGILDKKEDIISFPISREKDSIIKRCVDLDGQESITKYKVLNKFNILDNDYSTLSLKLETGRTHQIRVHLSHIGHPILGDSLYGNSSNLINRQALHCYTISFIHPITLKEVNFICNMPKDMQKLQP